MGWRNRWCIWPIATVARRAGEPAVVPEEAAETTTTRKGTKTTPCLEEGEVVAPEQAESEA